MAGLRDDDVVIVQAGLVTPIGLSVPEAAASARARVARLREIAWHDHRLEPRIAGTVPDDGLPPLAPDLAQAPLSAREVRWLRLAHAALDESRDLPGLGGDEPAPPLLLGLSEYRTTRALDPSRFLALLARQCPQGFDLARSVAAPRGRAAGLMALREAASRLTRREVPTVLVGGVDSLLDLNVLATLDHARRLRNEVHSDGFTPSEGAAFLHLCLAATARARAWTPWAVVRGTGLGHEAGHLGSDEPYRGDGLAAAVSGLLDESPPSRPIASVHCSFNGERYWAREFGVARLRRHADFEVDHQMEHPAECFGDLGAAFGPALAVLAAHGLRHGYRRAPGLVIASSDLGQRAAVLLDRAD